MQFLVVLLHPVVVSRRVAEYLWAREYQREVEFPSELECLMRLLRDAVSARNQDSVLEPGRESEKATADWYWRDAVSAGTQEPASESTMQFLVALLKPVVVSRRAVEYLWALGYQREVEFP